jgi:outer membrane protein assembly factor BamB
VAISADQKTVYIGSQDNSGGYLKAFNATNGSLSWGTLLGSYVELVPKARIFRHGLEMHNLLLRSIM